MAPCNLVLWSATAGSPPGPAEGAGGQHPLRHLPRAGPGRPRRWRQRTSPTPSACTPTRCPTSSACATSVSWRSRPSPTAVGRPQNLRSNGAPSLGLEPRRFRCWPGCSCVGRGHRPTAERYGGRAGARSTARCTYAKAASCLEALSTSSTGSVSIRPSTDRTTRPRSSPSPTALPRAGRGPPDLVCSLHRGMVEGFVDAMGDAEVEEFHRWCTASPARSRTSPVTCTRHPFQEEHP